MTNFSNNSMKVCIVVEGTYPYITGGVSSWIQMLIENMPEVEFDVVHLAPWRWTRSFSYKLPKNLKTLHEYLLFSADYSFESSLPDVKYIISQIQNLISFSKSQRANLFSEILKSIAGKRIDYTIKTKYYWDFLIDIYERYFNTEGFTSFYWTVVGFIIPILGAIQALPPKADIYHSTTTGYASLSALIGKYIHGGKLIVTEHGIYHRER
ncbi:MAG: GT4 family glycosyltransferase PelF, partial [Fervidobacterium sp.]